MECVFLCENRSPQRRRCLPNSYKLLHNYIGLPISALFHLLASPVVSPPMFIHLSCPPFWIHLLLLILSFSLDVVPPWMNHLLITRSPLLLVNFPHRLLFVHTLTKPWKTGDFLGTGREVNSQKSGKLNPRWREEIANSTIPLPGYFLNCLYLSFFTFTFWTPSLVFLPPTLLPLPLATANLFSTLMSLFFF